MTSSPQVMRWLRSVSAVAMISVAACKEDDWTCAGTPDPGVTLTVLDARSGANLEGLAVVTVDKLSPRSARGAGAPEQVGWLTQLPGTYEIRIVATGYATRTDTVTVSSRRVNGCEETVTQNRVAQLSPNR
jgi:hypothetical protein